MIRSWRGELLPAWPRTIALSLAFVPMFRLAKWQISSPRWFLERVLVGTRGRQCILNPGTKTGARLCGCRAKIKLVCHPERRISDPFIRILSNEVQRCFASLNMTGTVESRENIWRI